MINPFTAIGPENFRAYLQTYLNNQITSEIQKALSKAESLYSIVYPCLIY